MVNMESVKNEMDNAYEDIQSALIHFTQEKELTEIYELLDTARDSIERAMREIQPDYSIKL